MLKNNRLKVILRREDLVQEQKKKKELPTNF